MTQLPDIGDEGPGSRPAIWRVLAALVVFYTVAAVLATWPFVLSFSTDLPSNGDPPQALWILNWNKACLLEGKSPFRCEELQYPKGAPLGLFTPLHLQSALFVPISVATGNDVLAYNLVWLIGLVSTGLGVFVLAWHVSGSRSAAAVGGLLAMLSGPVMLHAHAHPELHYIGSVALFLAAWLRLLDRPSRGRVAAATASFVLMGACAAYFVVLATFPASLIAASRLVRVARQEGRAAFVGRLKWLVGFVAVTLPFLALLFSNQLWALTHGSVMTRSEAGFSSVFATAPLWGYFTPTSYHFLSQYLMPFNAYVAAGNSGVNSYYVVERASYLGFVTLLLMNYALVRRVAFRDAAVWWAAMALLVILGLGAYTQLGEHKVSLPALWLWKAFAPMRLLRTPARFNLLVVVPAAVVAAAGLARLLEGLKRPIARGALVAVLSVVAVVDLAFVPYIQTYRIPPMPAAYAWIQKRDPKATLFEWPLNGQGMGDRTYWQSNHRCSTAEGYSGVDNMAFMHQIRMLSPLMGTGRDDFLTNPDSETFGPIRDAAFRDYLWLFLKVHGYRYLLLHEEVGPALGQPSALARLREQLAGTKVFEDGRTTVFESSRLRPPGRPVMVCAEGWTTNIGKLLAGLPVAPSFGVGKVGRLVLFNPNPTEALSMALDAAACQSARKVRLMDGKVELAAWDVEPGDPRSYQCPPFRLPAGLSELELVSDAEEKPARSRDAFDEAKSPYSLRVGRIQLQPAGQLARSGDRQVR